MQCTHRLCDDCSARPAFVIYFAVRAYTDRHKKRYAIRDLRSIFICTDCTSTREHINVRWFHRSFVLNSIAFGEQTASLYCSLSLSLRLYFAVLQFSF